MREIGKKFQARIGRVVGRKKATNKSRACDTAELGTTPPSTTPSYAEVLALCKKQGEENRAVCESVDDLTQRLLSQNAARLGMRESS